MKVTNLILIITLLILLSCTSSCNKGKEGDAQQAAEPGSVFFLDISRSMMGYFRPTDDTEVNAIQQYLHVEFRNSISMNNLKPIHLVGFGSKNGQDKSVSNEPEVVDDIGKKFVFGSDKEINDCFSSMDSDLVEVFKGVGTYTASIIYTDSLVPSSGSSNIGDLINIINEKVKQGLHIYLIGVMSEFKGLLSPGPGLTGRVERFWYKGLKPIYIWIATYDPKIGKDFASSIVSWLGKQGVQGEHVKSISITDIMHPAISNIELKPGGGYEVMAGVRGILQIWINTPKSRNIRSIIDIPIEISVGSGKIEEYWRLDVRLKPEVDWAKVKKEGKKEEKNERWVLSIAYGDIENGSKFTLRVMAIPETRDAWWHKWNTEDDSNEEDAGKTLYLRRLGEHIIEPLIKKKDEYEIRSLEIMINKL